MARHCIHLELTDSHAIVVIIVFKYMLSTVSPFYECRSIHINAILMLFQMPQLIFLSGFPSLLTLHCNCDIMVCVGVSVVVTSYQEY